MSFTNAACLKKIDYQPRGGMKEWMDEKKDGGGGFYRLLEKDHLQITGSHNLATFRASYQESDDFPDKKKKKNIVSRMQKPPLCDR